MRKVIDGNTACALAAYQFTEMAGIYPITPSSTMAELVDQWSSKKEPNIFKTIPTVIEMQSEAGAAGLIHGAMQGGTLSTTFTSSQGLLLMIPTIYKVVGEKLPLVMHVAARSIATHSLSIMGDHQDINAVRPTGIAMLASSNPNDCYNMGLVAHLAAIKASYPVLHFFDGFRTSHEINTVNVLSTKDIHSLVDYNAIKAFKQKSLLNNVVTRGTTENDDVYFQNMEAGNKHIQNVSDVVNEYMTKINELTGMDYKPFNYYGHKAATRIIIAMGSVCNTIKEYINQSNEKIGLIEVHLYRPFNIDYLLKVLPLSVKKIAVLDRTKENGSIGEPLYLDIVASLKNTNLQIVGGRYGLSGKNTTIYDIVAIYSYLEQDQLKAFTVGINDDVTGLSLKPIHFDVKRSYQEIVSYGIGSDSSVTLAKNIINIIGREREVQGYFQYDSSKSNGITKSHIRYGNEQILASYYVTKPKYVVVNYDKYLETLSLFERLQEDGVVLINTSLDEAGINNLISASNAAWLAHKKVYTIDGTKIAKEYQLGNKISSIMTQAFFAVTSLVDTEMVFEELVELIKKTLSLKGDNVVESNIKAIEAVASSIQEIEINPQKLVKDTSQDMYEKIAALEGNKCAVSDFMRHQDGTFNKVNLKSNFQSGLIPKWIPDMCTMCMRCSAVCPHAVIRPIQINASEVIHPEYFIDTRNENEKFSIMVNQDQCTGCGLCVKACLGKQGGKALEMSDEKNLRLQAATLKYFTKTNINNYPANTVQNTQLNKPLFAYSKACSGCGETPYIKLVTQILGDKLVIANATGCSSIYGGSVPYFPYDVAWMNSLFEDNAEFAYGLEVANQLNKSNKVIFAIGGDGWAYDIGFAGIDQILSIGVNINILVLDTEVYSNTGGQASKSSPRGSVAKFAASGKKTSKKDLAQIAMTYENVYVANINLEANMNQAVKAINEAINFNGPSLIIAYSPCIAHGIIGGMGNSFNQAVLATKAGYWPLFRYNNGQFNLDSANPDFDLYEEFLNNEKRYNILKAVNDKSAQELLRTNKEMAIKRFEKLKKLQN